MISSNRIQQAKQQGKQAALATNCNPYKTKNPYNKWSAQGRAFSKGYSQVRNKFKFLWKIK